jgi:hypothetical protein
MGQGPHAEKTAIASGLGQIHTTEMRVAQGDFELSTGKVPCLEA